MSEISQDNFRIVSFTKYRCSRIFQDPENMSQQFHDFPGWRKPVMASLQVQASLGTRLCNYFYPRAQHTLSGIMVLGTQFRTIHAGRCAVSPPGASQIMATPLQQMNISTNQTINDK